MAPKDESVYDEESLSEMGSDEEISPEEEGFMSGYNDAADDEADEPTEGEEGKEEE